MGGTLELNLAKINEGVAEAVGDREAIIFRDRRITYSAFTDRTRRLANFLLDNGLGIREDRTSLSPWQSGQDHVGLYLYNGNEYLEGMMGTYKCRAAPFNVNYRYVDEELIYLLNNASTRALIFHSSLSRHVRAIRRHVPTLDLLIQVQDDDTTTVDGAFDYEQVLQESSPNRLNVDLSADDLYILYTGGTTGMPKGVLWRQEDIIIAALGGRRTNGEVLQTVKEFVERSIDQNRKSLPAPPFMHGAGHWNALQVLNAGGTVVIQDDVQRLNAQDILDTIEREEVNNLLVVGDAFGRPIADALASTGAKCPSLRNIITGGAIMTAKVKSDIINSLPNVKIIDSAGSSETGGQATHVSDAKSGAATGKFSLSENNAVISEDMTEILTPGHSGLGWWARSGNIPLGYLDDEPKTQKTFPMLNGIRYSVPGDKVRLLGDGSLELHGRESVTINSGGEKIFAEEVEQALKHHSDVFDAVVAGRPSERWGNEVVAIVQLRENTQPSEDSLLDECNRHIARYKLPKSFIFVNEILRSPSGKADYKWAKSVAESQ